MWLHLFDGCDGGVCEEGKIAANSFVAKLKSSIIKLIFDVRQGHYGSSARPILNSLASASSGPNTALVADNPDYI